MTNPTTNPTKGQYQEGLDELIRFYSAPIPFIVPCMEKDGIRFAGGNYVLKKRLEKYYNYYRDGGTSAVLLEIWCKHGHLSTPSLSDAAFLFGDRVKIQLDSPFLTSIKGVVGTEDGLHVAVDAGSISSVVNDMDYFPVRENAVALYMTQREHESRVTVCHQTVSNVVLLPYDKERAFFTPDQFEAINAPEMYRREIIGDWEEKEIVSNEKVIHPLWRLYNPEIVVPYTEATFSHNTRKYEGSNRWMGVYLPQEQSFPEMRAWTIDIMLGSRSGSRISACDDLGCDRNTSLGISKPEEKPVEGSRVAGRRGGRRAKNS